MEKKMKYLIRGIYAFAIGLNVGTIGMMLFTDYKASLWNQVIAQMFVVGVLIYWLMLFEKYEKRREETHAELDKLFAELNEAVSRGLEDLHRLQRDKRINRVLQEDTVQDTEERGTKENVPADERVQKVLSRSVKKVARKQQRKVRSVSTKIPSGK